MENNYSKPMRIHLVKSQHEKTFDLRDNIKNKYNLNFYATDLVKIAISELLENTTNDTELKNLLEKYNYI
jgi:hypothetical protein